ncbi:MAG: hypothetical protein FJ225_09610 [Lentisphaerae bacterium]|nr:hypothetical protein [Lentisphaerota bacterium]
MTTGSLPRHIYWSRWEKASAEENAPDQKRWFLEQTLSHGTMADIRRLDLAAIEEALPNLRLPRHVMALWRDYFERRHSHAVSQADS